MFHIKRREHHSITTKKGPLVHLSNLNVRRIIIHQVFQRELDGTKKPPMQSHDYTNFDTSAMAEFHNRVNDALGDGSHAVPMEIVSQEKTDIPCLIDKMIEDDDETFAVSSYDIAKKLTDAQHKRSIPGGIIVVFTGTYGPKNLDFLGIIKAEIHNGYQKRVNKNGQISLQFVKEVLLTPGTKLYKTAGFFEKANLKTEKSDLNEKWAVLVSDNQINRAEGKASAQYFYSDFLGCGYPQTSARTTKQFYEHASAFISSLDLPPEEKTDLYNALNTYLKVNTSSSISSSEFAGRYMNPDLQDDFTSHMEQAGLPTTAFTKDLTHIASRLKTRKITFRSKVKVTAPSETFAELVRVEAINGDPTENGEPAEWTRIIVKDRVEYQE